MDELQEHPFLQGALSHLLTVAGFLLALFLVARLMSEKRQPGNTFAWLLGIILVPYLGVPLYLLFGGRKLRRLMARKTPVEPTLPVADFSPGHHANRPIARAVTRAGAAPPLPCNDLQLITTGEDAYRQLVACIQSARHHIHITTFILGRDDTGRRLVALLAARARAGVKVRLLLDSVGSMFVTRRFVRPIIEAGGEVQWFMPVLRFSSRRSSANLRSHRKIAVIDHSTALIGGHNLAKNYMGPSPSDARWADFGTLIRGPAAILLNDVFIADWCFASHQPIEKIRAEVPPEIAAQVCGPAELQVVASGPDVHGDPLYEALVAMIQAADKSICIITPYFIPDEVLQRSLIVKARSGVAVTLLVPEKSNHPITDFARRHYLRELREAGVTVKLHSPGMLHSKATIVDGSIALYGSANFDLRSLFVNFEIGVLVHSRAEVGEISAWADSLLAKATHSPTTPKRPFTHNLLEDLSRLLAPLL
ncbi:cardiolipin synthase [Cephaloticoccus primus]|uniref:Cardiolipin synthase n=1 Tax=Cephaloticoccus primus TaxID=1548207 RepID=A0A139SPZ9_9BACT|nr:cardiolipin synthase [Cephaloticoccus primus]KXU36669.1 cardiolipin synthase [Cephaloticoccus primus]